MDRTRQDLVKARIQEIAVALTLLLTFASHSAAGVLKPQTLFTLERTTNRNQVIYEANLNANGFDVSEPIHVYWKMIEKGGTTEELNQFERTRAYGIHVIRATPQQVTFNLAAMPLQTIRAEYRRGKVQALTDLNQQEIVLSHLFLRLDESGLFPRLKVVDLKGRQNRSELHFKLYPEKNDRFRAEVVPEAKLIPSQQANTRL